MTPKESAENAVYRAIARFAKAADTNADLKAVAEAFAQLNPPPPILEPHITDSATMLESRFWDDGDRRGRKAGFTPRDLPKSAPRLMKPPDH